MTHDHNHNHDHDHSHDYSHSHELTFEQKLEKLFAHWINHNDSHKDTFHTWADRAQEEGFVEVFKNLKKVGQLSEDVTIELKKALKNLKN